MCFSRYLELFQDPLRLSPFYIRQSRPLNFPFLVYFTSDFSKLYIGTSAGTPLIDILREFVELVE